MKRISDRKLRLMKALYAANIFWAGIPGFLVTCFPSFAQQQMLPYMVGTMSQDLLTLRILGSIWLAVGILSIFGLRTPSAFAGIFLLQILYKSIWLIFAGVPSVSQGETRALPLAIGFIVMIIGFILATPWAYLFRPQLQDYSAFQN